MRNNIPKPFYLLFLILCLLVFTICEKIEKEMLVSTGEVTNISTNSADASGQVKDLGEGAIDYGHCYSKSPDPKTSDLKKSLGTPPGTGDFTSQLTNLEAGTKYYIKAYITDGITTEYGDEINFTTLAASVPALTTTAVTSITTTTAASGGNITSDGGATVTARGICWNSTTGPTTVNSKTADGTGTGSFVSSLTGLTANTTYYVRAYATNISGTGYGEEVSFTTSVVLTPPEAASAAATSVTNTTATLNGAVNPNGSSTTVTFEYGTTFLYGSTANAAPSPLTGVTPVNVSAELTGLMPGTIYHFRVKAVSDGGTTYGNDLTFNTLQAPAATTIAATSVSTTGATLNGSVNANGSSTNVTFEYGTSISYGNSTAATPGTVTGANSTGLYVLLTGLTPGTTYHFRVKAISSGGTTFGDDMTFSTVQLPAPSATTQAAANITQTASTLNGSVNANGLSTTVTFEYGTSISYGQSANAKESPVTGNSGTSVSTDLTGLAANTSYHYRVKAVSTSGTTYGEDMTFTTLQNLPPAATTQTATNVTQTTVTLNGLVNANGVSTTVTFEFGTTATYGTTVDGVPSPVTGSSNSNVKADITGLTQNTIYHYRIKAVSAAGTTNGDDMTFTTGQLPAPLSTTQAATETTQTSATLNGSVNANGLSSDVSFEYGTEQTYGQTAAATPSTVTGTSSTNVSAAVSGLQPNTLYHFRIKSTNATGTGYGEDMTFTTLQIPAPAASTLEATGITQTTATLNGLINANGLSTTVTFEYGLTTTYSNTVTATESPVTGSSNTAVSYNLTGLTPGTEYNYRVKAVSTAGTTYGTNVVLTTSAVAKAALTTAAIANIGTTSATSGGNITNDGGASVTARGVCWSATTGPTTSNPKTDDGTGTGVFVSNLTGLTAGTTYYVRAYATNSAGTAYGNELSFPTNTATSVPPLAAVAAATSINNTTATVNGAVNANGSSTTVTCEYGPTILYGSTANATPSPVTGTTPSSINSGLTGLTPGTLYHYRIKAVNAGGTAYSDDMSFTTLQLPVVTTEPATTVTSTTATLNGTVNATSLPTTVTFEYGTSVSYGSTANGTPDPVTGANATSVSAGVTGLTSGTIYHYRVKAVNSGGTTYGEDITFTTLQPPTATTTAATSVANTTATLNGTVNANGNSTTVTFEYGLSTSYGSTVTASQSPVTGTDNTDVSFNISGLTEGTIYHFRIKAVSAGGTADGSDLTFTTICTAPSATTNAASGIGPATATLNGTVNANGFSTTVTFEWGLTTDYGSTATASQSPVTGSTNTAVSAGLTGLTPNTTYHYKVKAVNCEGTSIYGSDQQFITICLAPTATTDAASGIGSSTATLNGTVNANGFSTTVTFEWGLTTDYGSTATASQSPVTGSSNTAVSAGLTGLTPNTTYHYKVKAVNCEGTSIYGGDQTFATSAVIPTLTTAAVSRIASTTAGSGGNITSDGGASVTTRGVCWNTTGTPTTANNKTTDGTGTGSFASSLNGLNVNTLFYVRAYATNSAGTAYGNEISFTTTVNLTDYDLNTYNTVQIGTQLWMQENLKVTHYRNGNAIPNITDGLTWGSLATGAYVWYNNDEGTYKATYGALYNYYTTVDNRNLCPAGWHVPTDAEWTTLTTYLGGENVAGGKLKETGITYWDSPNTGATNESGFTALPGAYRNDDGSFPIDVGPFGRWWSATEFNAADAWSRGMSWGDIDVSRGHYKKLLGLSIRCLQGEGLVLPAVSTTAVTAVTTTTATSGGNITSDGGASITARGICWNTSPNPTVTGSHTDDGIGTGTFTSSITGLSANTTYYARAFATNSVGTTYGEQFTIKTATGTLTDYDLNNYYTVTIGTQLWMKENLKVTHYRNGNVIPIVADNTEWSNLTSGAYSLFNDDLFYNYYTTVDNRILCPTGWHVPTHDEWTILENYLIANGFNYDGTTSGNKIAKSLAATTIWPSSTTEGAIGNTDYPEYRNKSGFNSLPSGTRASNGIFTDIGIKSYIISSTEFSAANARGRSLSKDQSWSVSTSTAKTTGQSVRCLQGEGQVLPAATTNAVTAITSTTASSGGNITSDGGASVTARGVCWSTSPNPVATGNHTTDATGTGVFTSSITGLTLGNTYYVRAYATNSVGTVYGNEVSFTTALAIGDSYQGGIVAYILQSGDSGYVAGQTRGLIAAPTDQSTGAEWGCYGTTITGADGTEIGTGNQNTMDIMAGCSTAGIAARLCGDLVLGGYDDWYLPSKDELNKLYLNRAAIGGFTDNAYWSSTEDNNNNAWINYFYTGSQYVMGKNNAYYVRAVRAFPPAPVLPTVTTAAASSITSTSATSGGNVTTDGGASVTARGICWNLTGAPTVINDHTSDLSGTGSFISSITGLSSATTYYVRAYATNSVGTAYGNQVNFTALCGSTFIVTHTAGDVAAVTKTVTYGTVVTNLTGTDKCWITQNLGADYQADSATAISEIKAGWYWQFNRKQGYKHSGSTRTPNTTWITSIDESSIWTVSNDPCTILLGTGWRLPTSTEWTNADNNGGWDNYNETYASVLKLHAAGGLSSNGSLVNRGSTGFYWSSLQFSSTYGWDLYFGSSHSYVNYIDKADGFSVRCLKD